MKRFFLSFATLMATMLLPLGQSSKAYAAYCPSDTYGLFITDFQADKIWKMDAVNTGSIVSHGGTIAWKLHVWNDRDANVNDYNMGEMKLFLYDGKTYKQLAFLNLYDDDTDGDDLFPYDIKNYSDCRTWCVGGKKETGEDAYIYMITEYSEDVYNYIVKAGDNIYIRVECQWDDNGNYTSSNNKLMVDHKTNSLWKSSDRKFIDRPAAPNVTSMGWIENDNKTAVKYTYSIASGCQLSIKGYVASTKVFENEYQDAAAGSHTEYQYPFTYGTKPTTANLADGTVHYYFRARKDYTASTANFSYHGSGTSVCPAVHYIYSTESHYYAPQFPQPINAKATDKGDGTVELTWTVDEKSSGDRDNSNFIIERSFDSNFANIAKTKTVNYQSGKTTPYSFIDDFSDRNQGTKTFYYRIHREHAYVGEVNTTCQKEVKTDNKEVLNLSATPIGNGKVRLAWNLSAGIWNTNTMRLRLSCNGSILNELTDGTTTSYTTTQELATCTPLNFTIEVLSNGTVMNSAQTVEPISLPSDRAGEIVSFTPSAGFYNDRVILQWKTSSVNNNFHHFVIQRQQYNSDDAAEVLGTVDYVAGVHEYLFTDKECIPGVYYTYYVVGYSTCGEEVLSQSQLSDIGFAQPYGVVSGQITYSGNQGVPDVFVSAVGEGLNSGHSLYFNTTHNPQLVISKDMISQMLGATTGTVEFYQKREGETEFRHIAATRQGSTYTTYINGVPQAGTIRPNWFPVSGQDWDLAVYDDGGKKTNGFIDEIRVWNIYRDSAAIAKTMNCYLNGAESGLTAYYRCDDNVDNRLFDISKTSTGGYNARHLTMQGIILDESNIPTTEQLSLRAYTDANGNYLINNIPFTAGGSLFNIVPMLGVHEFSPSARPLFFNGDATTHNSINFTDVSSFPVSGYVYYEGTNYPVAGCNFYVDGTACIMDNTLVESAEDGSFTISVPIGTHYIEVRKTDHTFVNGGCYPQPIGGNKVTYNFQQPMTNLTFYDNTLVPLTGRVAGGTDQAVLQHGMQMGTANIGKAHIVISPEKKETYNLNTSESSVRTWSCPNSCEVNSSAYTYAKSGSKAMRIAIDTDPKTGEFSVMVPPIDMTVDSISIPSNPNIVFDLGTFPKMELNNAGPTAMTIDTVYDADNVHYRTFSYTAAFDAIYRVNPELLITEPTNPGGMTGISQYVIQDEQRDTAYIIKLFEYDSVAGDWKYNFDVPYFLQGNTYKWYLRAFERYVNQDDPNNIRCDSVPLRGSIVTFNNQLATAESVREVQLDSVTGDAYYRFCAGDPLLTAPYSLGMSVTYTDANQTRSYDWEHNADFRGIVLGCVSGGNNFITEGPDHLVYVLRDPPGGQSYATLRKGTKINTSTTSTITVNWTKGLGAVSNFGVRTDVATGFGVMTIGSVDAVDKLTTSADYNGGYVNNKTITTEYTTSQDISTSPEAYYWGSSGDVYIGYSTNRIFGEATMVTFMRDAKGTFYVGTEPVISMGEQFKTDFMLSQKDIEMTQIPNYIELRNALLETVTEAEYNNPPANKGDELRYITTLTSESPQYGEEGTYQLVPPTKMLTDTVMLDMVEYYNNQINTWKARLADNERWKVNAIEGQGESKLIKNISIDGGAKLTESVSTEQTYNTGTSYSHGVTAVLENETGVSINHTGVVFSEHSTDGSSWETKDEHSTDSTTTTEYTFDLNPYEQLSVNIYDAGDGWSPVYSTLGGQTLCRYEGEERTKYYNPGKYILSAATQRMEDPKIYVEGPSSYSSIPVGGTAYYTLQLSNQSVVSYDADFRLRLMDENVMNGATLMVDGAEINTEGILFRIVDENRVITKTVALTQGRPDILEYKNIGIIFNTDCSAYDGADTVYLSATFIPACSDIELTAAARVVNTEHNAQLKMTVSGYDINLSTFTGCRLQYKQPMETNWRLIEEFDKEAMKDGMLHYTWDMSNINDGEYEVRAVTVCNLGGQEVNNESEVISIIKDMAAPEPLGLPSPINGIYTADNQIYVDFNEPIQTGKVITSCVEVKGLLNAHELSHTVALQLDKNNAYTQAEYDFNNTDFAVEMWLNWSEAGDLLTHGKDGLVCALDDAGHLQIRYAGNTWTSDNTLPKDTWCYLAVSYRNTDNANGIINVYAAYDATTVNLFDDHSIPTYACRGRIAFGSDQLKAAIHDVTVWNIDREWTTAISERNTGKDAYTTGLISYWPMDEGHGTTAADRIRYRDLTLADGSVWWYNNTNKALHIPAATEAVMPIYTNPTFFNGDYMFGFWFRSEATGKTPLFQINDSTAGYIDGKVFEWKLGSKFYRIATGIALNNGAWHHFAINSSHSFSPMVFIDGEQCNVPIIERKNIVSSQLIFSSVASADALEIDEIQLWEATISPAFISQQFRVQPSGDEQGLTAYYPMDKTIVDIYGQNVTEFTLSDQQKNDTVPAEDIYLRNGSGNVDATEAAIVPPVRQAHDWEVVKHTFTASDTRLMVNITEETRRIEGCPLTICVRDIVDMNGNYSAPVNWYVFVNRNQLLWEQDQVSISKAAMTDTTVTVVIRNASSRPESWSVTNIPDWLSVSETAGVLAPLSSKTLSFTVLSELGVGTHEQTLYLTGNENINQALHMTVKVNANRPDWTVNPADYEYSMNMIAEVLLNNRIGDDSEDILAAFAPDGTVCGIGHPQFLPVYGMYLVMMDIYSNNGQEPITFKYWDASTGSIYSRLQIRLTEAGAEQDCLTFQSGQIVGTVTAPVQLTASAMLEQTIALNKGWNWVSMNVAPADNTVSALLSGVQDKLDIVKSKSAYAQSSASGIVGSLQEMTVADGYKMKMTQPAMWTVIGEKVNPADYPVTLAGNGWTWMGYVPQSILSVHTALSNLTPSVGDIVKGQVGFATWDGYDWVGSLTTMAPGKGYMYYNAGATATLYYPVSSVLSAPARELLNARRSANAAFSPVNADAYQGNMTVTAVVKDGSQILEDAEIGIFAGEECRAAAVNNGGLWFITIPGNAGQQLTIRVAVDGEIKEAERQITYVEDAILGTPSEPFVIQLGVADDFNDDIIPIVIPPLDVEDGLNDVSAAVAPRKYIYNDHLVIEANGKKYNAVGF